MARRSKTHGGFAPGDVAAGAGVLGLLGFATVFAVAIVFFVIEGYFISLLLMSFALLIYVAGAAVGKLLLASIAIFFSGLHLVRNATYLQETVRGLRRSLRMRADEAGAIRAGPIEPGATATLPDNPLSRELQAVLRRGKGKEYAGYVAHDYYVDCR